jgi:hypothetical protein
MEVRETTRNGTLIERVEVDYDKGVVIVTDGKETTKRALTDAEIAESTALEAERSAGETIHKALQVNKTFLALEKPTAAQVAAQTKALTRQVSALLKLQLREYSEV